MAGFKGSFVNIHLWPLKFFCYPFRPLILSIVLTIFSLSNPSFAFTDEEIRAYQKSLEQRPLGERIAFWAERFLGTPYDPDPLGEYVRKGVIVNDERVDCMYLSFRVVELALSRSPEEAIEIALEKRFMKKGILKDGRVQNYDERFQYGEDMLESGKWGKDVTAMFGRLSFIDGARGRDRVTMISKADMISLLKESKAPLQNGDFLYFIKSPERRIANEIVGHIGIVKIEDGKAFLIHASGSKGKGGVVKKVPLINYLESMTFAGVQIGRFTVP